MSGAQVFVVTRCLGWGLSPTHRTMRPCDEWGTGFVVTRCLGLGWSPTHRTMRLCDGWGTRHPDNLDEWFKFGRMIEDRCSHPSHDEAVRWMAHPAVRSTTKKNNCGCFD